jgi:hypothetical protein
MSLQRSAPCSKNSRPSQIAGLRPWARYLTKLEAVAENIADWNGIDNHVAYRGDVG